MNGDGSYPRETQELVLFDQVTVNGVPSLNYVYQLQRESERPSSTWLTPVDVAGSPGFMLQPVTQAGTWIVWLKVTQGGQQVIIEAGEVVRS